MRNRIDSYMAAEAGSAPPLVVLAERLSARIGSMTMEAMQADPSHWVGNQGKLRKLLALDGVVIGADKTLAAEACGQTLRWSEDHPQLDATNVPAAAEGVAGRARQAVAIEAVNRLCKTERAETGCVAMMTGPVTLAAQLYGDTASHLATVKPVTVELVEQFCQARPDLLLLREGAALGQSEIGMPERKAFNTLKNMAAYFDVPVGLYLEDYHPSLLPQLAKLKLPFLWLGADAEGALPDAGTVASIAGDFQGLGLPLNLADPAQAREQASQYAKALDGHNYLLTSTGELAVDHDLDNLITLIQELHN